MSLQTQLSESIFAHRSMVRLKFQQAHKDEAQSMNWCADFWVVYLVVYFSGKM